MSGAKGHDAPTAANEQAAPGAFGAGYIYNPAVFGDSPQRGAGMTDDAALLAHRLAADERDKLATQVEKLNAVADAARVWVATEDAILSSPGISGTEAWNRTRRAHRDAAAALAALDRGAES